MNQQLWNEILAYDLDAPFSEYSFSLRLANENHWTKNFTELAVLEYKKFMYLAAISDMMVSPSGIIDVVWHQHLIFTQSYEAFCTVVGKRIQHVPSTHNREDFQRFRQAKERTRQLYEETFGNPPSAIWACDTMYDDLNLSKGRIKIRSFINWGVFLFICLLIPFYILLKPVYALIDNPDFMYNLLFMTVLAFISLEVLNRYRLKKIAEIFNPDCFVYHLRPMELVYLKTQKLENVINGTLDEMLEKGLIYVNRDGRISAGVEHIIYLDKEEAQVIAVLNETGPTFYSILMTTLKRKPVFSSLANSMDAFKKYIYKSHKFGKLFYFNFATIAILVSLSATRVLTGLARERPVLQIMAFTFLLILSGIFFLRRLTRQLVSHTIPAIYVNLILPRRKQDNNWQWTYFLIGTAALSSSLMSLMGRGMYDSDAGSGDSSSSGGDCGSSCSSCGGCGGD